MSCSERKLAANRANAQRSTGPITAEGKANSRKNAVRHGLTADVLPVAGEQQAALEAEREAWVKELAPAGHMSARFAEQAFRAFVRLQRCERSNDSALASRIRRAEQVWETERAREVRLAIQELEAAPSVGVAALRSTTEGCRWLIAAWQALEFNAQSILWSDSDYRRATDLLGIEQVGHLPLFKLTQVFVHYHNYREVVQKHGYDSDASLSTLSKTLKEAFCLEFIEARTRAQEVVPQVLAFIAEQIEELTARAEQLAPNSLADRADAESFCLFDASDEARLRHRYTVEAEREMHRSVKAAREAEQAAASQAEVSDAPPAETQAPALSRNEPTATPAPDSEPLEIPANESMQFDAFAENQAVPPLSLAM